MNPETLNPQPLKLEPPQKRTETLNTKSYTVFPCVLLQVIGRGGENTRLKPLIFAILRLGLRGLRD